MDAYSSGVPGLCLVYFMVTDDWSVTHERSGRAVVTGIGSKSSARRIARKLREVTDWTQPAWKLKRNKTAQKAAHSTKGGDE